MMLRSIFQTVAGLPIENSICSPLHPQTEPDSLNLDLERVTTEFGNTVFRRRDTIALLTGKIKSTKCDLKAYNK